MTPEGKESICEALALLFSPPDQELVEQVREGFLHSSFLPYILSYGQDPGVLKGFLWEGEAGILRDEMRREYERLFLGCREEGVSLVESFYRPWTLDPHCTLPFASDRGLVMGDPALHLLFLYEQCGLEVSREFGGRPDHLILELEFLAHLYQRATDSEIKTFIRDHLGWTFILGEELKKLAPKPFYESAFAVLSFFLKHERERLGGEDDGKKDIH
jgi:putative dimethyl sulfoxide reductase chaperone